MKQPNYLVIETREFVPFLVGMVGARAHMGTKKIDLFLAEGQKDRNPAKITGKEDQKHTKMVVKI